MKPSITIPVRLTSNLYPLFAQKMVESVRMHMKDVKIVQIAEPGAKKWEFFDDIKHIDPRDDFVRQLFEVLESFDGNVLALDYDIILHGDVSHVFDHVFDVAVTTRPAKDNTIPRRLRNSLNLGVVFSRTPKFWTEVRKDYEGLEDKDGWLNSQTMASMLIYRVAERYMLLKLPGEVYNYTPFKMDDDLSNALIVHYKGQKKNWMLDGADCKSAA